MDSSSSPGTLGKRPSRQSSLACSMRSRLAATKFHHRWRSPSSGAPPNSTARLARTAAQGLRAWRNHQRLAPEVRQTEEWAFINNGAHDSALLTCYVRPAAQVAALRAAGFSDAITVYGQDGRPTTMDTRDTSVHLLATKPTKAAR